MKSRKTLLLTVVSAALVGAAWFGWRVVSTHSIAVDSIPPRPNLRALPPVLSAQLTDAEAIAHRYFGPNAGLADVARLYHAHGFFAEASRCYRGLSLIEPNNARWPYLLAGILAGFGRLDEAMPLMQRAIALAPDYLPARIRLADTLLKTNKIPAAIAAYNEVLRREPANAYAHLGLARCYMDQSNWPAARDQLQAATATGRDTFGGWATLVTVYERLGDTEAAAAALRRARSSGRFREMPDAWLDELTEYCFDPYRLGVVAAVTTDKAAARRWLERAISLVSNPAPYHRQLGKMLWDEKNYPDARSHLEKAVANNPVDSDAWAFLIGVQTDMRDLRAADRTLATALSHCPQSAALRHLNGQRLRNAGRLEEAIPELLEAKKLQPNEARAYIELAMVYFSQQRTEEGIAELRGAVAAEPGNTLAMQVLARHAINTSDEATARLWIRQLQQQPNTSEADMKNIISEFRTEFGKVP